MDQTCPVTLDQSASPRPATTWRLQPLQKLARRLLHRTLAHLPDAAIRFEAPDGAIVLGNGPLVTVRITDPAFYPEVVFGGTTGSGAAYAAGLWTCDDLPALVKLLARNRQVVDALDRGWGRLSTPLRRVFHWLHRNSKAGARANIAAHYDLGNDFFRLWLDHTMSYSSCWFATPDTDLDTAAIAKLERVCQQLDLRPGQHLVEIGTGWGGLAIHAARHHGVRVTTTTISAAQAAEARSRVAAAGLSERVTVLELDYRDLPEYLATDRADRVVSIEMVEAIGHRQYDGYFSAIRGMLRDDGLALIQAITIPPDRYHQALRDIDFIQRYIFPGSEIPSTPALAEAAGTNQLELIGCHDFARHYAATIRHWRERFLRAETQIRGLGYPSEFIRRWEFYLAYCEGGFHERAIGVAHLLFAAPRAGIAV